MVFAYVNVHTYSQLVGVQMNHIPESFNFILQPL